MKRLFFFISFLFYSTTIFATYYDTGWKTFTQPDGSKFAGRIVGDDSFFKAVTIDSFIFDKNFNDGFYYYAQKVLNKRYQLSNQKVGIDVPIGIPKNLFILLREKPEFPLKKPEIIKQDSYITPPETESIMVTAYTLNVILVEFADIKGDLNYSKSDFEEMLSGDNYYNSPNNEKTYGSMKHYYDCMSNGAISIDATVLNKPPGNDSPDWITLPHIKADYRNNVYDFWADAENYAQSEGLNVSTSSTTKLVYIYAGNFYLSGLCPAAIPNSNKYIMCEKWGGRGAYDSENPDYKFSHIGIHCHEFGHLLGFLDLYVGPHPIVDWCLMADGCDMERGARPAPINPHYRFWQGWINVNSPPIPNSGIIFEYDEVTPDVKIAQSGDDYYYIEYRKYQDFSSSLPGDSEGPGGLLVWHAKGDHEVDLIEADGRGGDGFEGYGDMFPGLNDVRHINDFTTPNLKRFNNANSNAILHFISDPEETMNAIFGEKWFGELPLNLTWQENILLADDVIIPFGKTLTIKTNSGVEFNSGAEILIGCGASLIEESSITYVPSRNIRNVCPNPPILMQAWSDPNANPHDPDQINRARLTFEPVELVRDYVIEWRYDDNYPSAEEWREVEINIDDLLAANPSPSSPVHIDLAAHQHSGHTDPVWIKYWVEIEGIQDHSTEIVVNLHFPPFWGHDALFTFRMQSIQDGIRGINWSNAQSCTIIDDPGEIALISPIGGELWHEKTHQTIQWQSRDFSDQVKIFFNSGMGWQSICGDSTSGCGRKLPFFRQLS